MTLSVPYSFVPGTKAKAGEVNANFISVLNDIEDLNSRFIAEKNSILNSLTTLTTLSNEAMKKDMSNIDSTAQAILDAKANLNLENTTLSLSFYKKLEACGIRTVIRTYKNGASWYRIYSDGWCEQGGSLFIDLNSGATVVLLVPYIDTTYFCTVSYVNQGFTPNAEVNVSDLQTSMFTIYSYAHPGIKLWHTAGYINLEDINEL